MSLCIHQTLVLFGSLQHLLWGESQGKQTRLEVPPTTLKCYTETDAKSTVVVLVMFASLLALIGTLVTQSLQNLEEND